MGKQFWVKPFASFRAEVEHLARLEQYRPKRIFLADGDAFVLPTEQLVRILRLLHAEFPGVERVSIYASALNVKRKSDADLRRIREAGLELVYIGLESGDDEVLRSVNKGATNQDNIGACLRLKASGFTVSPIIILGLGGTTRTQAHAKNTAATLNTIDPPYLAALTLMLVPGTKLHTEARQGTFHPLNPLETLEELRLLIDNLTGLTDCTFRTNHASNYLPLRGVLSRDRPRLLAAIDAVLADPAAARRLRPEGMRGL
jgi:coproporphyrinogen III oxidase-like Fe-S oxidoreductase